MRDRHKDRLGAPQGSVIAVTYEWCDAGSTYRKRRPEPSWRSRIDLRLIFRANRSREGRRTRLVTCDALPNGQVNVRSGSLARALYEAS